MKLGAIRYNPESAADLERLLEFFVAAVLEVFDFRLASWQLEIAREIFYRIFLRRRHTITISACRQVGKTETVCFVVWFLTYIFPIIAGERFRACFVAPERGTSSEVYDRTKLLFDKCEYFDPAGFQFEQKNLDAIVLKDGSRLEQFGLFKAYAKREDKKTVREGRTFHLLVRDEMHVGDDEIYKDELEPALATTGGLDIWIGNGGFRQCEAKRKVEAGNLKTATVFKFDYDTMVERMRAEYAATGNELFLRWLDSQEKYIEDEGGRASELVRKNLLLEWIVEFGSFCNPAELHACRRQSDPEFWPTNWLDVGIDWGKEVDLSVVTVTDYANNIRTWGVFRGDYTTEQIPEIVVFLRKFQADSKERVVFKRCYFDSTGAGDVVGESLKKALWFPAKPVVFSASSKDILGRKGLKALRSKEEKDRLSYPANHKHAPFFEKQMTALEKEFRSESGKLNYHHPDKPDAHDDFPDSYFLSIYGIQRVNTVRTFQKTASAFA